MSSKLLNQNLNEKRQPKANISNIVMTSSLVLAIAMTALATSGCNTTQGFKPTASVMVGGHKSI
ncbi:hypothetical protein M0N77_04100 [Psychrobacter sp. AH5]|uniref:hypothetical protein n=1 Tax=Psychrobacter sp. AH5 TaxID=2937433 RepID=UPI0033405E76